MQGCHRPDNTPLSELEPGDYAWQIYADWEDRPSFFLGDGEWHLRASDGGIGAIRATTDKPQTHMWVEHEDGSVTFSPSIVMPNGWHGWLQRGQWSTA